MPSTKRSANPRRYRARRLLDQMASDSGLTTAQFVAEAGLPLNTGTTNRLSLTSEQYLDAWAAFERLSPHATTIDAFRQRTYSAFRAASYAFACCATVQEGLTRFSRLRPLSAPVRVIVSREETLKVSLDLTEDRPPLALVYAEIVHLIELVRQALDAPLKPLSITVPNDDGRNSSLEHSMGAQVNFGDMPGVEFSNKDAARNLSTAAPILFGPTGNVASKGSPGETTARLRLVMPKNLAAGDASISKIAQTLQMTARTLQRKLGYEDTSFGRELDTVRHDLADLYLRNEDLCVEEISQLLAFKDPNSFYRAYQGWTGEAPGALRR